MSCMQTDLRRDYQPRKARLVACALMVVSSLGGCNNAPECVPVTGTITVNGNPLSDAVVVFQPDSAPASRGTTDQSGRFELTYATGTKGARLGRHDVLIFHGDHEFAATPLARYRAPSELTAKVEANAVNYFEFALTE